MSELISIIIPIYNMEKYLKKCIDSIRSQTYKHLEIILVDDGSDDASRVMCDEFKKQDIRVKVIHKKNGGLSEARNRGLEIAAGEWISFIDSDDYIEADMMENLLKGAIHTDSDMAVTGMIFVDDEGKPIKKYLPKPQVLAGWDTISYFLKTGGGNDYVCNKLYRKHLFDNIRFPVGRIFEDTFVMYQLIALCKKVVFISELSYYYLQRHTSISNNLDISKKMDSLTARMNKLFFVEKNRPDLVPLVKQEIIQNCGWLLCDIYKVRIHSNDKTSFENERRKIIDKFYEARKGAAYTFFTSRLTVLIISISPKLYCILCRLMRRVIAFGGMR